MPRFSFADSMSTSDCAMSCICACVSPTAFTSSAILASVGPRARTGGSKIAKMHKMAKLFIFISFFLLMITHGFLLPATEPGYPLASCFLFYTHIRILVHAQAIQASPSSFVHNMQHPRLENASVPGVWFCFTPRCVPSPLPRPGGSSAAAEPAPGRSAAARPSGTGRKTAAPPRAGSPRLPPEPRSRTGTCLR